MTENSIFKINNKVEIIWNDEYYKSSIADLSEEVISISIPTKDGEYIPLRAGEFVEVMYYFENKIYKFYSSVLGRKIDVIPIIMLEMPDEIYEVQRRKDVRVSVLSDVEYSQVSSAADIDKLKKIIVNNNLFSKATLLDLSGSGMKAIINDELKLNDILLICIVIDDEKVIIKGTVVRTEKLDNKYICGINFIDMDSKIKEKIVRHIFSIMRSQIKRIETGD